MNDYHPDFTSNGVGVIEEDEVIFTMTELKFDSFEFQIKITANGGYVYYTDSQIFNS